jgi:hypothetical protein
MVVSGCENKVHNAPITFATTLIINPERNMRDIKMNMLNPIRGTCMKRGRDDLSSMLCNLKPDNINKPLIGVNIMPAISRLIREYCSVRSNKKGAAIALTVIWTNEPVRT